MPAFLAPIIANTWFKIAPWMLLLIAIGIIWAVWGWKSAAESKLAVAEQNLRIVEDVNRENQIENAARIKREAIDRAVESAEIERNRKQSERTAKIKKETSNAPDAKDLAGPYWDDVFDRVRD